MNQIHSNSCSKAKAQGGFTLIEVMVAFGIGMVLVFLAYQTLSAAITSSEQTKSAMAEIDDISRSMYLLESDFRNLINRDTSLYNVVVPSGFTSDDSEGYKLKFIRAGRANPMGIPRSSLQQVGYRWDAEEKILYRDAWPETIDAKPEDAKELQLMKEVESFELRFLPSDANDDEGPWLEKWPDEGKSGIPAAVEVTIETPRFGRITRLIMLENG